MSRKIAIATGTRADWGLLAPIAKALRDSQRAEVFIIATNMHLDPKRGNTIREITRDGLEVYATVPMPLEGESSADVARSMSRCLSGFADVFERLNPDSLIILGDRFEMLAVASAATVMHIPIIHIAGGEVSEGAIDDNIRHAITKLSALHLTATEEYRQRVIAMGEQPDRVVNTGAIGVYNILNSKRLTAAEIKAETGLEPDKSTLFITLHPATMGNISADKMTDELLAALDRFPENKIIFTYPNNDEGGDLIIRKIEEYAAANSNRAVVVPSLGQLRYLSVLQYIGAVVGNSSSGIVEVPSMKIPVVNIRPRQDGRLRSEAVIHVNPEAGDIAEGIRLALSEKGREAARTTPNPYYQPDTLGIMVEAILGLDPDKMKKKVFYDIPHATIK